MNSFDSQVAVLRSDQAQARPERSLNSMETAWKDACCRWTKARPQAPRGGTGSR